MASKEDLLEDIATAPQGPDTLALFDFDGTVIAGYSALTFLREALRQKEISISSLVEVAATLPRFGLSESGFSTMMAINAQFVRGLRAADYRERAERLYESHIAQLVYPEARALIDAHRGRGHTLGIVSSATPYQVEPAARKLQVEHVYCTELEIEEGYFTGGVMQPACFGEGKILAAQCLASQLGTSLEQAYFYSDSRDDLPLLQSVGQPRVLNGNSELEEIARYKGWLSTRFSNRGRPTLKQHLKALRG